jgi:hypothetical protein
MLNYQQTLRMLLDINEPSVTREVAGLISSLLSNLDGMQIWLKMDAGNICVNSAAGDNFMILKEGDPARLPADRGLYRNWGGYFDQGDHLSISNGGLGILDSSFSVTLWITLPIVKFTNSSRRHVILAPSKGKGITLLVDETGSRIGAVDEKSGHFVDSGNDFSKFKKGWHHIAVVYEGVGSQKYVTFYIDGKSAE